MLCVNSYNTLSETCNFKQSGRQYAVKIGRDIISTDEYVKRVDADIFIKMINGVWNNFANVRRVLGTCNFAKVQVEQYVNNSERALYKKVMQRCYDDIAAAIANKEPKEKINKLEDIAQIFIRKFGYLE